MAESDVIRSMVLSFRLQELQTLLSFAGKNKMGRKTELQTRALNLLKQNDPAVIKRVKEMSSSMFEGIANAPSINPHSRTFIGQRDRDENPTGKSKEASKASSKQNKETVVIPPDLQPPRRELRRSTRESSRASAAAIASVVAREKESSSEFEVDTEEEDSESEDDEESEEELYSPSSKKPRKTSSKIKKSGSKNSKTSKSSSKVSSKKSPTKSTNSKTSTMSPAPTVVTTAVTSTSTPVSTNLTPSVSTTTTASSTTPSLSSLPSSSRIPPPRSVSPPVTTTGYRYNIPPSYFMNIPAAPRSTPMNLSTNCSGSNSTSERSSNSSSPQIIHQSPGISRSTVINSANRNSYATGVSLGYTYNIDEGRSDLMYPTFPDVRLKKLPFYKVLAVLMQPCSLQPSGTARFQEQKFSFYLSPSQVQEIASSAYRDANGKPDNKKQVQMRFSLLETSCEQDDNFPSSISVKVNNKLQSLPNPIPTNKPGVEPKRPPKPINITSLCKLSSTLPNFIDVSWAVDFGKGFTISVYFVDKLSSSDLLKELKSRGTRLPDYTRALIKEKLNDKDSDIATTSCKVTLACPLGKMRMSHPCRANTCDHLQCFDANLFLMMNERKPKWLCPVCNKPAIFDNLLLDGFFKEVLLDTKLPSDDHEIVLHNDGTWEPLPPPKEDGKPGISRSEPKEPAPPVKPVAKPVEKIETFSVDDDDDDNGQGSNLASSRGTSSPQPPNQSANNSTSPIDCITLDSDEDGNDSDTVLQSSRKRNRNAFLEDTPSPPPGPAPMLTSSSSTGNDGSQESSIEEPVIICLEDD